MLYPGKRDWWIAGLLGLMSAAFLVFGAALVGVAAVGGVWQPVPAAASLVGVGAFLLWVLQGTSYAIDDSNLIVRCGPFRKTVPLDAIEEVVPAGFWDGGAEWGFSLCIRGLRVRYRKKSGRLSWPIRIGPQDRAAFLLELTERLPALQVKDDGSLHRSATA